MAFYVMKRDPSYAAGAHCITMAKTRAEAERKARGMDGTINGRPAGPTSWTRSSTTNGIRPTSCRSTPTPEHHS